MEYSTLTQPQNYSIPVRYQKYVKGVASEAGVNNTTEADIPTSENMTPIKPVESQTGTDLERQLRNLISLARSRSVSQLIANPNLGADTIAAALGELNQRLAVSISQQSKLSNDRYSAPVRHANL